MHRAVAEAHPPGIVAPSEGVFEPVLVVALGRSKTAVRVIRVWAIAVRVIWVRAILRCRCRRIVVWRCGSGSRGADYGARCDTGGNATPAWPVIATPADVDVAVDINVAVDVSTVEIPAVNVGAVEVPAVDTASGGAGPGTSSCRTAAVAAASGVSSAAAITAPSPDCRLRHHDRRLRARAQAARLSHPPSRRRYCGPCCRSRQPERRGLP